MYMYIIPFTVSFQRTKFFVLGEDVAHASTKLKAYLTVKGYTVENVTISALPPVQDGEYLKGVMIN